MNRRQTLFHVPVLAIGLVMLASPAKAVLIQPNGSWVMLIGDELTTLPTAASPYSYTGGPWTMNVTTPVKLTVTDWLAAGDLFKVYNHNLLLGSGSAVAISGAYATTPDLALGNPRFSQNSWILQPGDYSFTFKSSKFAPTYYNGTIAFKAELLPVPESAGTLFLLGLTLAGVAGLRSIRGSAMDGRLGI